MNSIEKSTSPIIDHLTLFPIKIQTLDNPETKNMINKFQVVYIWLTSLKSYIFKGNT